MIYNISNIEKEKNKRINNNHQNHPILTRNKMVPGINPGSASTISHP